MTAVTTRHRRVRSAETPSAVSARTRAGAPATRPKRPGPAPAAGRSETAASTRDLVFAAAAAEFSTHGFDGVSVDAIAAAAGVNKAMIYYHFEGKLGLYRAVVRDMLEAVAGAATEIAASPEAPDAKIERFIQTLVHLREARPWFPPLMMREMAAGAPHLDPDTLALIKAVFVAFAAMLQAGVAARMFRKVHPVLAYMTIMGPLMMNAVRERAAARPGRAHLPMFATIDRRELVAHMQLTALRMLAKDQSR